MKTLKKPSDVRAEFNRVGKSVAQWSRDHKVSQQLTYQILAGRKKGLRGQAHKIAVLLGLKRGIVQATSDETGANA